MEYKPWPLLILAFFHFIEPISKIIFYSVYFQVSPIDAAVIEYQAGSAMNVFEYFFLFPIAGFALFSVKKWSFPVFIIVEIWVFAINLPYLNELYQLNQLWLLGFFILFGVLNVFVVGYLLLPAVRIAYMEPRIRWWEAKPRYSVNIKSILDDQTKAEVKNISKSGVFMATHENLAIDSEVDVEFTFAAPLISAKEFHIKLKVLVLHKFFVDNIEGYGAKYIGLTAGNKFLINALIKCLEKSDVERRPPRRNISDLIYWFTTLVKTGKGLFPQKATIRKSSST